MNQILFDKKRNIKKKKIFKTQLILSIIIGIIFSSIIIVKYNNDEVLENISEIVDKNARISQLYKTEKINGYEQYLGKIIIDKINLEYTIFNKYDESLLKIAPCKFYGGKIGEEGNICIVAHNYNDNRFFGRIAELEVKDVIKLIDIEGNEFEYIVYDNFEIDANDFSVLKRNKKYELSLLTCNNLNQKRIIIKAYMKV